MAIGLRDQANANTGTLASITATTGSAPQVGDLAVVISFNDFITLADISTPTATGSPSFTAITGTGLDVDGGTNQAHIKAWTYVVNTAGAQAVVATYSGGAGNADRGVVVLVLSGADTSTPVDAAAGAFSTTSTAPTAPAVSPATSTAYLICHTNTGSGLVADPYSPPSGMTEQYDVHASTVFSYSGATVQLVSSGSTGTKAFTSNVNRPWGAVSIAVKTAAAGGGATYSPMLTTRRRVQTPPRKRPKAVTPVPAQVIVPRFPFTQVKEARQVRGRLPRRGRTATPVPPQVIVPPIIPTPGLQPRRLRGLLPRRGRVAQVVPAQIVVAPPGYPPQPVRVRLRAALARRYRNEQVVPQQVTPPVVAWPPQPVRVRVRAVLARRGRVVTPPATDVRVPLFARLRARLVPPRRGRTRTPVPPQVVVAPPAYPPQPLHRTRRGLRRRTHNVEGWMVGSAVQDCTTPRPFTGTTAYSTATTARPGSGTTTRPGSGTTARPDTGTTTDPC